MREALARLSVEGFVEAEDQKGFRVADTSRTNLSELSRMRALVECDGLRRSIEAGGLEWEGRVVAAMHKLRAIEERDDTKSHDFLSAWTNYDYEFHRALISDCGSQLQLRTHRGLFDQFRRYVYVEVSNHGFRGRELCEEHDGVGIAALDRDADRATELLAAHLSFYVERQKVREDEAAADAREPVD